MKLGKVFLGSSPGLLKKFHRNWLKLETFCVQGLTFFHFFYSFFSFPPIKWFQMQPLAKYWDYRPITYCVRKGKKSPGSSYSVVYNLKMRTCNSFFLNIKKRGCLRSKSNHKSRGEVSLEPVCCKKQQKKLLTSYWFVEQGNSEGPE